MRKVLVVEDDKFISAIFTMFLRDLGHEMVGKCADGGDAVDLSHRLRPDVVLMDIHLEGEMDGIQTAEQLRRELDIPVIYVSSDTSSQVIKRAIVSNSYGFLVKPVNKKELGIAIDLAYYKHKVDQEQRERERGYRQFISEASMPLMILQDGRVMYLNNLALDLYKTHYMEDVLLSPYLNFVGQDDKETVTNILNGFSEKGQGFDSIDIAMTDVHGQSFYAQISGSSIIFNKKKSLQVTILDRSKEVYVQKRNALLLKFLSDCERPYIIVDSRMKVKAVASHPLFDGMDLKGKRINQLSDFFQFGDSSKTLTFENKGEAMVFQAHEIYDAANKVYEIVYFQQ
ncbi:response regulator [Carboxylicivirga marina]|uniref:Response regulator n=1 Tax=Carboxylicivirga marina TaxID=2800988 RepID=A0ABS1HHP5_9BACT|nr:response regulator [Carboxylicivirga marina]MBK3517191.1 response regulator [Carboxylicivirga marina]